MKILKSIYLISLILLIGCDTFNKSSSDQEDFSLIPFIQDGNYGYFNQEGKIVINPQFHYAEHFFDGLAVVGQKDKTNDKITYGFINKKGEYVINCQYKHVLCFSEGLAGVVKENGKIEYINKSGEVKFTLDGIDRAEPFHEGLAIVSKKLTNKDGLNEDMQGYINTNGEMVIVPQFKGASKFSDGLAKISQNTETGYGYINTKGEIVINPQFRNSRSFKDGLAVVISDAGSGLINKKGELVVNHQFQKLINFGKPLLVMENGDKWGYVDKKGKIVINAQFDMAMSFDDDNKACVFSGGKWGLIDKDGKYIVNPQFNYLHPIGGKRYLVKTDRWGIINKEGKFLVNPQFKINEEQLFWKLNAEISESYDDYGSIQSDFFDIQKVVSEITKGFGKAMYMGLNENATEIDITAKYGNNIGRNRYDNNLNIYLGIEVIPDQVKVDFIEIKILNGVSEQVPIYKSVQKYDASQGGFITVQEIERYETKSNSNASIESMLMSLTLNLDENKKNILMKAIADDLATKCNMKITRTLESHSFFRLENNNQKAIDIRPDKIIVYINDMSIWESEGD